MPDVTVPSAAPLATIPRVELMKAGQWHISTGMAVFSPDDLASAVAAMDCPAVRRPVLKLGHVDPRFDGEPAVGSVSNLATADGGSTLVGDYTGMPGWLGDVIASAYPDRSIEGQYDYKCQVGHVHPFVVTAVALLGVTAPGIGNLASLTDIGALFGVAASAPETGVPFSLTVHAAAPTHTGAMVALIPSDADAERLAVDGGELVVELHTTLVYLGEAADWDEAARQVVLDAVRQVAAGLAAVEADGFALSMFNPGGDEPCVVLSLGGAPIDDVHTAALAAVTDGPIPEQRAPWIPHVTLMYTDDAAQVGALVDRTGPVTFDRLRVAFGDSVTDFPLDGTPDDASVQAAGERSTMPNPKPTMVAAKVSTEDIRRQYYDDADWDMWITQMHVDPLQLIVCDDSSGNHYRVPITVTGDDSFEFGAAVEVSVEYVDKPAKPVAATRIVFASRAESRPGKEAQASDPAPPAEPEPTTQPEPGPAPELPAAEPEPTTDPNEEDPVSDLSEFRSRLGLADDADEAAILAALDARLQPAEPTTETTPEPAGQPEPVAASTANPFADELKRVSEELSAIRAREAAGVKASVLDGAVKAGKIRPAEKDSWSTRYDKAPEVITDVLASIADGTAVPVGATGYTGSTDTATDDDAAFEDLMARLDGPTAVKGN